MTASQKSGVANPTNTNTVVALSKVEYWRVAEVTPTGTAMATMMSISTTLSASVMGSRSRIMWMTGRPCGANERPKSSQTMRLSQLQYCSCSGLSSS